MKRISQREIATKLGVSQSLVSIVLNGRREGIAPETYEKIWACAKENGYSPRGMRMDMARDESRQMRNIGYFLRSPLRIANKSNFFSHVHQGMHDYLGEHGVNTVFLGSEDDFDPSGLIRLPWDESFFDGIVVMGQVNRDFLLAVKRLDKPLVYLSARATGLCHSVNGNEMQAGETLVEHLFEAGHRRFAYCGGTCAPMRNQERLEAVEVALANRGLDIPEAARVVFTDRAENERNEGFEAAGILAERFKDAERPTAWIFVNGLMARGGIRYLSENGDTPGSDVSVCAFDMTRVRTEENPSLTGAGAIPENLGREAGRLVLERSSDANRVRGVYSDIVLPAELFSGESSGPPARLADRQSQVGT